MVFLKGWMGSEKLIYNITLWTVNTTDQDAIFANLGYQFSRKFSLYAGLTGNPGSRSLNGSHPFWLGHDRVMADEFFRPFFGSGIYATGEALPGLWYTRHRLEQQQCARRQGEPARPQVHLRRDRLVDADDARVRPARWRTATGSGTRNSPPASACRTWTAPSRASAIPATVPENTTLRLADSVNLFETGALAPGVTIEEADYQVVALDAGVKYRGMYLQAEYYWRTLDNFMADGLLPAREIKDTGFYVQGSFYPIKQKLEVYGLTSQIYGDDEAGFGDSSEYGLGMNWYPFPTRNHRLNVQLLDVNKSPVSSTFGYYTGGQDGWTLASSFSVFF